jgi:hypothetical protein
VKVIRTVNDLEWVTLRGGPLLPVSQVARLQSVSAKAVRRRANGVFLVFGQYMAQVRYVPSRSYACRKIHHRNA